MPRHARCYVPNCVKNNNLKKSFHELPANMEMREKWIEIISSYFDDMELSERTLLCNLHFHPSCYKTITNSKRRNVLQKNAIPTIFTNSGYAHILSPTNSPQVAERVCLYLPEYTPNEIKPITPTVSISTEHIDLSPEILIPKPEPVETKDKAINVATITKYEIEKHKKENKMLKVKIRRLQQREEIKKKEIQELQKKIRNQQLIHEIQNDADANNSFAIYLLDLMCDYKNKKRLKAIKRQQRD